MKRERPSEPTIDLVRRLQHGDEDARTQLIKENLEPLRRWALTRVAPGLDPNAAEALVRQSIDDALPEAAASPCQCEGDVQALLRMDILRRLSHAQPDSQASLCQLAAEVGPEIVRDYESGLLRLSDADRRLIILRLELGMNYDAIAEAIQLDGAAAASAATRQAIVRLAEAMGKRT